MPTTPNFSIPYPTPDDLISQGPEQIKALAEAIDQHLNTIRSNQKPNQPAPTPNNNTPPVTHEIIKTQTRPVPGEMRIFRHGKIRILNLQFIRSDGTGVIHTLPVADRPIVDIKGTAYTTGGMVILGLSTAGQLDGSVNSNHSGQLIYFTN